MSFTRIGEMQNLNKSRGLKRLPTTTWRCCMFVYFESVTNTRHNAAVTRIISSNLSCLPGSSNSSTVSNTVTKSMAGRAASLTAATFVSFRFCQFHFAKRVITLTTTIAITATATASRTIANSNMQTIKRITAANCVASVSWGSAAYCCLLQHVVAHCILFSVTFCRCEYVGLCLLFCIHVIAQTHPHICMCTCKCTYAPLPP